VYSQEEIREAHLDDFRVFLCEVWAYLNLPKPTPVQLDIAYQLQHSPRRFIIQAFRGVGKSWILVAFVLWQLFLDPQKKIMVVSANQGLADSFSIFAKQLIEGMPLLQHLRPNEGQRDSSIAFDVGPATPSKDPSVKSVGITGQLTGSRADIIVADDIEVPKNSYTFLLRERLSELVKEFDAVLKPDGRVIYLGTPQNEETLYVKLETRGYVTKIWPSEVPAKLEVYRGRLAEFVVRMIERSVPAHTPIDPARFDREDLNERMASYGRAGYALQFMLDTSLSDVELHPLKCRDLIVMDVDQEMGHVKLVWGSDRDQVIQDLACGGFDGDHYVRPVFKAPEMSGWTGTVMAIDPSGKGKDETGYAIVRSLYGKLYLVDVGGFTDGFAEGTLKSLAAVAARFGVNYIICEENYGGGMFVSLLKPHLANAKGGTIDEEYDGWSKGQKELRILDILEPLVQSHKLVVDRRVIEKDLKVLGETPQYSFIHQFTRMARMKGALPHEDRLEAVAMACGYFVDRMARDENKMMEQHKEDLLDQELRTYMDHVYGRAPEEPNYLDFMRR